MPKYLDSQLQPVRDDVRLRAIAHGRVFRRSDLIAWGLPADTVIPMLRREWWVRLHHGVYADVRDVGEPGDADNHLIRCAAGIRALAEPAYAFAASAALLHGLAMPGRTPTLMELIRPRGRDGRALSRRVTATDRLSDGVVGTHPLAAADVTEVSGIPTVSATLAAVTAATRFRNDWIVATLDSAAWQAPERIEVMRRHADGLQHRAGIGEVRAAMNAVRSGAQTPLESLSRVRLMRYGLPEPRLQVPFHDEHGLIGIVDMYWDDLGVIGEADGMLKYRTGEDLIAEKRREDRLRRLRPVVRWDWGEIMTDPAAVAARIRSARTMRRSA